MNKLAKRAIAALVLAGILATGMLVILIKYFVNGSDWVTFQSSPHVYSNGALNSGVITDRSGTTLLDATNGRSYAESGTLRKATLHLLGDREGNITPFLLDTYGDYLVGYDAFNGTYHTGAASGEMTLTISAAAQKAAYEALAGRKGTVGVYNYKTGEILCMVSTPSYDPDDVPDIAGDPVTYDGAYVNRFLHSTYPPGSVYKLVTAAAALEHLDDLETRTFYCEGSCVIDGETVVCNNVHGTVTFEQALAKSCNVAFAEISLELEAELLTQYAERTGVLSRSSFDGTRTAMGSFDVSEATRYETAWAGIGQYTDQINPCQFMVYMGAIANGGAAAEPYVVQSVAYGDSVKYKAKTHMTDRMIDVDTAASLADIMHYAVQNVYGEWYFSGLYAGAKSGTAEVGNGLAPNAVFAGFTQDDDYPLAFVVIVENGGSGSSTCTPIIKQVLDALISDMNQ